MKAWSPPPARYVTQTGQSPLCPGRYADRWANLYELVTCGANAFPDYSEWIVPNSWASPDPRRYGSYPDVDEIAQRVLVETARKGRKS
jgi:hypothetical protein